MPQDPQRRKVSYLNTFKAKPPRIPEPRTPEFLDSALNWAMVHLGPHAVMAAVAGSLHVNCGSLLESLTFQHKGTLAAISPVPQPSQFVKSGLFFQPPYVLLRNMHDWNGGSFLARHYYKPRPDTIRNIILAF